jgi:hypothetical protein
MVWSVTLSVVLLRFCVVWLTVPEAVLVTLSVGRPLFRPLLTVLRDICGDCLSGIPLMVFEECEVVLKHIILVDGLSLSDDVVGVASLASWHRIN